MGFFDSFPPPEPPQRPRRPRQPTWRRPPFNVVNVALAVDAVLLRNGAKAVYVNGFDVYPNGFAFVLNALRRGSANDAAAGRPMPPTRTADPFAGLFSRRGEPPTPEQIEQEFHLGVRYADGRSAELEGHRERRGQTRPTEEPLLSLLSGHGSEGEWTQGLWAWGIPDAGDVELVYRWPAEQVSESSLVLDGDRLRDAAARAVTLWIESDDEGDAGYARG